MHQAEERLGTTRDEDGKGTRQRMTEFINPPSRRNISSLSMISCAAVSPSIAPECEQHPLSYVFECNLLPLLFCIGVLQRLQTNVQNIEA